MSLQNTPAAMRAHIAFFGVRNAGKSSLVNAVTGQELSVVSDVAGTTTDPVKKTMELLPLGPVVIIDTPGIDDAGALGEERVRRAKRVLEQTDLAVLVVSAEVGMQMADRELISLFEEREIPFLIVRSKADLDMESTDELFPRQTEGTVPHEQTEGTVPHEDRWNRPPGLSVSAKTGEGIRELKEALARLAKESAPERPLVSDLISPGDLVVLVIPIDKSAPKGRLILPQQLVIRDLLDTGAQPLLARDTEYASLLARLLAAGKADTSLRPALVITDSQVFGQVSEVTPEDVPLTSFSMLMARHKGTLDQAVHGAKKIAGLSDGDTVLIAEGCTHHRQCEDIGTVKFPKWLSDFTGKDLRFSFTSGGDFPEDLSPYALVIHCGGCMLNEREMRSRSRRAADQGIPVTNYGVAIAFMRGILDRVVPWQGR